MCTINTDCVCNIYRVYLARWPLHLVLASGCCVDPVTVAMRLRNTNEEGGASEPFRNQCHVPMNGRETLLQTRYTPSSFSLRRATFLKVSDLIFFTFGLGYLSCVLLLCPVCVSVVHCTQLLILLLISRPPAHLSSHLQQCSKQNVIKRAPYILS